MILYTSGQVYGVIERYVPIALLCIFAYLLCDVVSYTLLYRALGKKCYIALIPFYRKMLLAKIAGDAMGFVLWAITPMTYIIYCIAYMQVRYDLVTQKKYGWFVNFIFTLLPVIGNVVYYFLWRREHVNLYKKSGLGKN